MSEKVVKYANDEIIVLWRPEKCIHSAVCVKGLGQVFNPREKQWIKIDNAPAADITTQIDKCPSGALGYEWKKL